MSWKDYSTLEDQNWERISHLMMWPLESRKFLDLYSDLVIALKFRQYSPMAYNKKQDKVQLYLPHLPSLFHIPIKNLGLG